MCSVVHCKKEDYDVYIGRGSKWGNPFSHLKNSQAKWIVSSRSEAISKYKDWITTGEGSYLLNDLIELEGMRLGCWCKPKSCHGDILCYLSKNKHIYARGNGG